MLPIYPNIPVLIEMPDGACIAEIHPCRIMVILSKGKRYYYCKKCGGWIEGDVIVVLQENTSRIGSIYYCRRLGHELAFVGYN